MKKLLLCSILGLMTLSMVSCSKEKVKTVTADLITTNLSEAIVTGLECAKADVVTADVKAKVDATFKIEAENAVAEAFCKTVVDIVIPQVLTATIPATWECKATNATETVTTLVKTKACEKL